MCLVSLIQRYDLTCYINDHFFMMIELRSACIASIVGCLPCNLQLRDIFASIHNFFTGLSYKDKRSLSYLLKAVWWRELWSFLIKIRGRLNVSNSELHTMALTELNGRMCYPILIVFSYNFFNS